MSQWCFNGCEVVDAGSGVACRAYPGETIVACASCAIDDPGAAVTRAVAAWLARHEEARDLDAQAAALDALAVLEDDLAVALGDQTATSSTANEEPQP